MRNISIQVAQSGVNICTWERVGLNKQPTEISFETFFQKTSLDSIQVTILAFQSCTDDDKAIYEYRQVHPVLRVDVTELQYTSHYEAMEEVLVMTRKLTDLYIDITRLVIVNSFTDGFNFTAALTRHLCFEFNVLKCEFSINRYQDDVEKPSPVTICADSKSTEAKNYKNLKNQIYQIFKAEEKGQQYRNIPISQSAPSGLNQRPGPARRISSVAIAPYGRSPQTSARRVRLVSDSHHGLQTRRRPVQQSGTEQQSKSGAKHQPRSKIARGTAPKQIGSIGSGNVTQNYLFFGSVDHFTNISPGAVQGNFDVRNVANTKNA